MRILLSRVNDFWGEGSCSAVQTLAPMPTTTNQNANTAYLDGGQINDSEFQINKGAGWPGGGAGQGGGCWPRWRSVVAGQGGECWPRWSSVVAGQGGECWPRWRVLAKVGVSSCWPRWRVGRWSQLLLFYYYYLSVL